MNKIGKLYIVATPIGHLQDITLRALGVLKEVDRIFAEDTRHAGRLLQHFAIKKPLLSLHEYNERDRAAQVLNYLQQGENVALVSDAGTPLISDPGFILVREVKAKGISVLPVPGACAAIAALSASGLPTHQFIFEGFLPVKQEARRERLAGLALAEKTLIFYEAPHRVLAVLSDMCLAFGAERQAVVAKELTKIHESIEMRSLIDHYHYFKTHAEILRGEFVILVEGLQSIDKDKAGLEADRVLDILLAELPIKQAAKLASQLTGQRKNEMYERALKKKSE